MKKYTSEFLALLEKYGIDTLLKSSNSDGTLEDWENRRSFIAKAIDKPGSFLDIGCANGFFLRSLQEWADHEIGPYGIDIRKDYIQMAKQIFGYKSDHFSVLGCDDISDLAKLKLPSKYDFVYRSIWRKKDFEGDIESQLHKLLSLTKKGGKVIVGIYGGNANPIGSAKQKEEHRNMRNLLQKLMHPKFTWSKIYSAEPGHNNFMTWIQT